MKEAGYENGFDLGKYVASPIYLRTGELVQAQLKKIGITLRVTPHVNSDHTITLDLHPEISELSAQATVQGLRELRPLKGSGPAESHQREGAGIVTPLHRDDAQCTFHMSVDDLDHPQSGGLGQRQTGLSWEARPAGQVGQGIGRGLEVE